jgi:uncharacterized membrane protein
VFHSSFVLEKAIKIIPMITNDKVYLGSPDNPKTAAVVCYFTIIGWVISYYSIYARYKTSLAAYHLRQSLLLHIILILIYVLRHWEVQGFKIVSMIIWFFLWLWGFINAVNQKEKPIPVIGEMAQMLFKKL